MIAATLAAMLLAVAALTAAAAIYDAGAARGWWPA